MAEANVVKTDNSKLGPIDSLVKDSKVTPGLVGQTQQTTPWTALRWISSVIGNIDVNGGSAVPGGYSVRVVYGDPDELEGQPPVEFYHDGS